MLGQKGGSGKTTLAVHLAVVAQEDGESVAIIDTDPHASATSWVESREHKDPPVATVTSGEVDKVLEVAREKRVSLVIIDTAPHASPSAAKAIIRSDHVLVPCRPTAFDLAAVGAAVSIAEASRKPGSFILNACPPRSYEIALARETLETYDFPIAPIEIGHRQAYVRAVTSGMAVTEFEPEGRAAEEMRALWSWVKGRLQ
jgi:chromosome partitioning protein